MADDPTATPPDPRFALARELLGLAELLKRQRTELDEHRKAVSSFARLDELAGSSRVVCVAVEGVERLADAAAREVARASAELAREAYEAALTISPELPTDEEPKP